MKRLRGDSSVLREKPRARSEFSLGISGSKKAGLPPGTLVHVGDQKTASVEIHVTDYSEQQFEERTRVEAEACGPAQPPTVRWIDVVGLHEPAVVETLGKTFGLHRLTQEDILNTQQRPKVEVFDDYVYIVIKMLALRNGSLVVEQVSLILGKGYLLGFHERPGDAFEGVRKRLRSDKGRIRRWGADYLAYALMDVIVDNYFVILEDLAETTAALEDHVLADCQEGVQQDIYLLKRKLATLRKVVWPLREMTSSLQRAENDVLASSTHAYLRDLYDHSVQALDAVETLHDVMSGLMDLYLNSLSNRMNAVMKTLTMIATIFIPLTFIAGIYGMNFDFMPELRWKWAYPALLAGMSLLAMAMLYSFRRKKWL